MKSWPRSPQDTAAHRKRGRSDGHWAHVQGKTAKMHFPGLGRANPNGIPSQSPRLPPRGYLGSSSTNHRQPQRGCGQSASNVTHAGQNLVEVVFILGMPVAVSHRLPRQSRTAKRCQKVAGGRSVAETSGKRWQRSSTPAGCQTVHPKRVPEFSRRRQRCVAAVPISAAGFVGSSLKTANQFSPTSKSTKISGGFAGLAWSAAYLSGNTF